MWGIHAGIHRQAAISTVEGGEAVGAVAQHGYAVGLQPLQRQRQVEDSLGSTAHHDHGRLRQFGQIGGNVERLASVHTANAAGGEDLNARLVGDPHRRRHRRRAVFLASHDQRQVAAADFAHALACSQPLDLLQC